MFVDDSSCGSGVQRRVAPVARLPSFLLRSGMLTLIQCVELRSIRTVDTCSCFAVLEAEGRLLSLLEQEQSMETSEEPFGRSHFATAASLLNFCASRVPIDFAFRRACEAGLLVITWRAGMLLIQLVHLTLLYRAHCRYPSIEESLSSLTHSP